jgi:hypothetical protein
MNLADVAYIRLVSQQIEGTKHTTVKDIVGWMGGMQAQDLAMAKWAIGIRIPGSTAQVIESAINKGEIIRTHVLRPTWHFVSADDITWMLSLTAPKIKAAMNSRQKQLGLTEAIFSQSNTIMENALRGGKHLTREEILDEIRRAKISLDENRASHLLARAELDGIVCSGAIRNGKQTYALLEEWVPRIKPLDKEAALACLAKKYFTTRCPATLQDFIWWSGLPVSEAKRALEMIGPDFNSETIHSQIYWFPNSHSIPEAEKNPVHLLPAFDEYIISYKDRSAAIPFEEHNKAISNNGIFRPVVVVNGRVTGIWKRTIKMDKAIVETVLFTQPDSLTKSLIEKAAMQYGFFLGKKIELILQ